MSAAVPHPPAGNGVGRNWSSSPKLTQRAAGSYGRFGVGSSIATINGRPSLPLSSLISGGGYLPTPIGGFGVSGGGAMGTTGFEDELLEQLHTADLDARLRVITKLNNLAKVTPNWFQRFARKAELFVAFNDVLLDKNWEVQQQCIKFIAETLPHYGQDVGWCVGGLLPALVTKLGSSKITVRRVAVQACLGFIQLPRQSSPTDAVVEPLDVFQTALVQHALNANSDPSTLKTVLRELPNFFVLSLSKLDWSLLVDGLTALLLKHSGKTGDKDTANLVLTNIEKLLELIGISVFNQVIQVLPERQRLAYESQLVQRGKRGTQQHRTKAKESVATRQRLTSASVRNRGVTGPSQEEEALEKRYRCGIVPIVVWQMLTQDQDAKLRVHGLEQLKSLLEGLSDGAKKKLQPHLFSYLNMLAGILDDLNYKVVVLALDVLRISVDKMRSHIDSHLQQVITVMSKHFGNQKAVVKQLVMMTCMDLMQATQPKQVIAALCVYLQHRNSRVREEVSDMKAVTHDGGGVHKSEKLGNRDSTVLQVLNVVTAALLKYPSTAFNLSALAHAGTPPLADPKRRVRLAAFELLSVLAQNMGTGKLEPLFKCVREVEHRDRCPGLMTAVQLHCLQARLARHQMPRVRYDGLIEYSVYPISDFSATNASIVGVSNAHVYSSQRSSPSNVSRVDMADYDWIMSGAAGPGSAISRTFGGNIVQQRQRTIHEDGGSVEQTLVSSPVVRYDDDTASMKKSATMGGIAGTSWRQSTVIVEEEEPMAAEQRFGSAPPLQKNSGSHRYSPTNKRFDSATVRKATEQPEQVQTLRTRGSSQKPSYLLKSSVSTHDVHKFNMEEPNELSTSLDRVRFNAVRRREEFHEPVATLNNNHLQQPTSLMTKSRSETQLAPDDSSTDVSPVAQRPSHLDWDEQPIRPMKNSNSTKLTVNGGSLGHSPRRQSNSPRKHSLKKHHTKSSASSNDTTNTNVSGASPKRKPVKPFLKRGGSVRNTKSTSAAAAKPPALQRGASQDPLKNPEQALSGALKRIADEEWTEKVEGIKMIQTLADSAPKVVISDLHNIVSAILIETKNLRSSVSHPAITCFGTFFLSFKRGMDAELERVTLVLMQKCGDVSSAFIRESALQSLEFMVDSCSPTRSCQCLITAGATQKSAIIRTACAQLLCRLIDDQGATAVLSNHELCERVLPQALIFARDKEAQGRYHGKQALQSLNTDPELLHKAAGRLLNDTQRRELDSLLASAKHRFYEERVVETIASVVNLSTMDLLSLPVMTHLCASTSFPSLAYSSSQTNLSVLLRRSRRVSRRRASRTSSLRRMPKQMQDSLDAVRNDLTAQRWEIRIKGCQSFETFSKTQPHYVAEYIQLVQAFVARMTEVNSKVTSEALASYVRLLPSFGGQFSDPVFRTILIDICRGLCNALSAQQLKLLAQNALDASVNCIDNNVLIIPFAAAAKQGNFKQKPDMLQRLTTISRDVCKDGSIKLVELHVVPVLVDLIKSELGDPNLRVSATSFAMSLCEMMGGQEKFLPLFNQLSELQKTRLHNSLSL